MQEEKTKREIYLGLLKLVKTKQIVIYDEKMHHHRKATWQEKESLIDKNFFEYDAVQVNEENKTFLVPIPSEDGLQYDFQWEDRFKSHYLKQFVEAAKELGYMLILDTPNYCAKVRTEIEEIERLLKIVERFGGEMPLKTI